LAVGWLSAIVGALLTAAIGLLLCEGIAFLADAGVRGSGPTTAVVARAGAALFYEFHHIGFVFEVPPSILGSAGGLPFFSERFSVALAPLAGTLLVAWLLGLVGRKIGRPAGGSGWHRGLAGAKVAVPYAGLLVGGAMALRTGFAAAGGRVEVHPSVLGALAWPLGIGLAAGFLGGAASGGTAWASTPWGQRLRSAVAGGLRTMAIGLGLAFLALLGLAAAMPHATRAYLRGAFRPGAAAGSALILLNLLALPNLAAWVLFPSMGACVGAFGESAGAGFGSCVLSYSRFPRAGAAGAGPLGIGAQVGHPPVVYYLFVLLPAVAIVLGGAIAARRSGASTRPEAAVVGAMAGVAFGILALAVSALSVISVHAAGIVGGPAGGASLRLGPDIVPSFVLALAWGIVGGTLGGLAEGRTLPVQPPAPPGPGPVPIESEPEGAPTPDPSEGSSEAP
jgi:hypothetical protein